MNSRFRRTVLMNALADGAPGGAAAPAAAPAPAAPLSAASALIDTPAAPAPAAPAPTPAAPTPAPAAPAPAPAEPPKPADALAIPGKDATPAQWSAFYRQLGAPENADGYQLPVPEGGDAAFAKTAATWMAEAGLMPQQAKALAEKWNTFVAEQATLGQQRSADDARLAAERAHTENVRQESALKTEWGSAFDANMGQAKQAVSQYVRGVAGDKTAEVIGAVEAVLGYAATTKLFQSIGRGLATGQARGMDGQPVSSVKSLEERLYPNSPSH
jgi:hypothetical protein